MKFRKKTVLAALLGGLICALTILFLVWIAPPQPSASKQRDVELTQRITGSLDTPYDLTINGTLPGDQLRAFISLDARNRHATINSLQLPGNLESLYIDEKKKLAYLANSYSGLQIVDISDPLQLRLRGSLPDIGTAWDLVVQDSVLYLASAQSGLYLIDIRSAENPSIISHLSFKNQSILKLAVSNQTVYASTGTKGLLVIDITDLTSPRLVNTLYAKSGAWGLLTEQNRMYLSCGKYRLEILDLSSPENPRKIGELAMPGIVWNMRIVENVLYLPIPSKALQLIDVSNAYQPKRLESSINLMHPNGIDLHQNRAYIL
ncbi:MAG: beta-propeller domain-containing protein, partial [Desulfuromonadales bacterium]|nr:beta-propeller domain-containing protein [Desulfuromonadales bacterium]